jgi:hypothetical protein
MAHLDKPLVRSMPWWHPRTSLTVWPCRKTWSHEAHDYVKDYGRVRGPVHCPGISDG